MSDWKAHLRRMQAVADRVSPRTFLVDIIEPTRSDPGTLWVLVGFRIPIAERKYAEKRWGAEWMTLVPEKELSIFRIVQRGVQEVIGAIKKKWRVPVGGGRDGEVYLLEFYLPLDMEEDDVAAFLSDVSARIDETGVRRDLVPQ